MIAFRDAVRGDVPAVVALLADDVLGQGRESDDLAPYLAAFDAMAASNNNRLIVGELEGRIAATYQLTFIDGLSLKAARRAQIESVRVASDLRGGGYGEQLIGDAKGRARAAGCSLLQLTANDERKDAHRFYQNAGFDPTHVGFKLWL